MNLNEFYENLDANQRSVKQLPALFKPKNISPVLGSKSDPKNPMSGYLVGANEAVETSPTWYIKIDGKVVKNSNNEPFTYDDEEAARRAAIVMKAKPFNHGKKFTLSPKSSSVAEGIASEDVISNVKKLGDYLQDVATSIRKDPTLINKNLSGSSNDLSPAVKTIQTDDGHEIKIHGNEDDGFRISVKNKPMKSNFKTIDEATMACEIYCAHRKNHQNLNSDYVEEKSTGHI